MAAAGGPTRWLEIAGDPRDHYIPRMDWAASSDEVILQRLNRLQNTDEVMLGDARTGQVRTVLTEHDSTWVDVVDDLVWLQSGKEFTWVSERDGWKHVYAVSRDGKSVRLVTKGNFDVLEVKGIDDKGGWLYYVASPDNPTQKYLFRTRLDGKGNPAAHQPAERAGHARLRPLAQLQVRHRDLLEPRQPAARSAWSGCRATRSIRTLVDNARLRARVAGLRRAAGRMADRSRRPTASKMPGVLLKPADFDSTRKYPLLFFVYGGPGNAEVEDQWGGYYLWHTMLTQKGYLVAIVDNRGTPAPLGRAWRKAIYGQLGVLETQDQAAAATDAASAAVRGPGPGRHLGMELRRVHDPQRAVPAPRAVPDGRGRLARDALGAVRQRLHRALQRAHHRPTATATTAARRISYVNGFKGNLLLVHGSGDDNVHFQNSELLINALVAANKPFQMMEYPNRTHCICQGKNTTLHLFSLITRFLDEHLLGPVPAAEKQANAQ